MSADDMAEFYVHSAIVETFTGVDGYGRDLFNPPYTLDPAAGNGCFLDDSRKLVRDANGEQVVSETTLYTYPVHASRFTPGSRVTVEGRTTPATVIKVNSFDSKTLDLPDHVAVTLT